jgi:hypothetical protein
MRDGANPYGETELLERAKELGSPTADVYGTLFTSYIQPPTSALLLVPLTLLDWREATRLYLVLNNLFLAGAIVLTMITVRPSIPWRWAIAAAVLVAAFYTQTFGSFALGQVDGSMTFLLALGLWGYSRGRAGVTGVSIALATAIKLIPALLILYFVLKREYRFAAWGLGAGAALFLLSLPAAGVDTYWTYFTETVPALLKGSTHYANISIGGAFNRIFVEDIGTLSPLLSLDEVPLKPAGRALTTVTSILVLALVAVVLGRRSRRADAANGTAPSQGYVLEYYLVVGVGLLISSVTWEFYVVWLLPLFVAVAVAPGRLLPADPVRRLLLIAVLVLSYVGLNYPGDHYLFDVNSFFYYPEWVPGIVAEDFIDLYPDPRAVNDSVRFVPMIRLATLSMLVLALLAAGRGKEQGA